MKIQKIINKRQTGKTSKLLNKFINEFFKRKDKEKKPLFITLNVIMNQDIKERIPYSIFMNEIQSFIKILNYSQELNIKEYSSIYIDEYLYSNIDIKTLEDDCIKHNVNLYMSSSKMKKGK